MAAVRPPKPVCLAEHSSNPRSSGFILAQEGEDSCQLSALVCGGGVMMEDDLMVAMRREYEVLARPGGIDFAGFKRLMRKVTPNETRRCRRR